MLLTVTLATMTPFASHVVTSGPHRYQVRVPPQLGVPVIFSVAESVPDEIVPFTPICCDVEPKFCCVDSDPPHPPSWLRVKSNSVAVGLAEDRVSGTTVLKHEGVVPPWPERLGDVDPALEEVGGHDRVAHDRAVRGQPIGGDVLVPREVAGRLGVCRLPRWWAKGVGGRADRVRAARGLAVAAARDRQVVAAAVPRG